MTDRSGEHSPAFKRSRRVVLSEGLIYIYPTVTIEEVHIDALTDGLLGSIISELEPKERVRVEAVSRRWSDISRRYAWSGQTHLDDSMLKGEEENGGIYNLPPGEQKTFYNRRLTCLLERCFTHLRELRLDVFVSGRLHHNAVHSITAANNLTVLELDSFRLTVQTAALIGQRLPKLQSLNLTACFGHLKRSKAEQALTAILKGCRSLRELDISENTTLTGETSFLHLPPTLRTLSIEGCYTLHSSAIDHLRSACADRRLRELNISSLPIDCPVIAMGRLFEQLPLLKKLVYTYGEVHGTLQDGSMAMAKIGAMKGLQSLELGEDSPVTDEVLEAIVTGCEELEEFSLSGDIVNYTFAGLLHLAHLPRLTSITFKSMRQLSEERALLTIANSGRLEKLALVGCQMVTDAVIQRVLEQCACLRQLNIIRCPGITNATIKAIGDFVAGIVCKEAMCQSSMSCNRRSFRLNCRYSSIKARPGELEAALEAAHPAISVRQYDIVYHGVTQPSSLHISW